MPLNRGHAHRSVIAPRDHGLSVLEHLALRHPHSSREQWLERIMNGEVTLEGRVALAQAALSAGQTLVWQRPPWQEPEVPRHFRLIYHDEALLAVDKPSGLPSLPGGGFQDHTLLSVVHEAFPEARPLHRLGRGTSGLVLFARTAGAAAALSLAWREHRVHKRYRALSSGLAAQGHYPITTPIGPVAHPRLGTVHAASPSGKPSSSVAHTLERRPHSAQPSTLFEVEIHTGRPHQIRIHLASIGHPLLGDPLYGTGGLPLEGLPGLPGDMGYHLHAASLVFSHPLSGEVLHLYAPPPPPLRVGGVTMS